MKTVFVIGAGAGVDIGMPTGEDLKNYIPKYISNFIQDWPFSEDTNYFSDALGILATGTEKVKCWTDEYIKELELYQSAAQKIADGLLVEISIDNFLDKHRGDKYIVQCGKLIITTIILLYENISLLGSNPRKELIIKDTNNTWLVPFYQRITENCLWPDLPQRLSDITFINFNYDRCLEHFLYHAFMRNYAIKNKEEVLTLVKHMNIVHPYGCVGEYSADMFGNIDSARRLIGLSQDIKTFMEQKNTKTGEYEKMSTAVLTAERIIFLGFAFHKQNMELLGFDPKKPQNVHYYGTAFGTSDRDIDIIQHQLKKDSVMRAMDQCDIINKNCVDFFKEFQYSLKFNN